MPSPVPIRTEAARQRRRRRAFLLLAGTLLLFAVVFSQSWFNLTFLRPRGSEETLVFAALSALIFLLLVALTFVLVRNVVKLYAERKLGVLGSKFRTRMVIGALVLSFAPVILLCFFAYGLMNRSIVKWYSRPIEEVRENTAGVASMLTQYAAANARAEAQSIAQAPETLRAFSTGNFSGVVNEFRKHEATLQGGFAVALTRADNTRGASDTSAYNAEASFHAPLPWPVLREQLTQISPGGSSAAPFELGGNPFMLGAAPVGDRGIILVAVPLPQQFTQTLDRLDASRRWYMEVAAQLKQVRRTYIGILLLVTLLVLFAATWLALFVAKLVTRPVAALAEATQEISRGRLEHRIAVPAADELGELVGSFNDMAGQLQASRQQLEESSRSLERANSQLDQRRREIETILESIPTGVLSIGPSGIITHANSAFTRMVGNGATRPPVGGTLYDVFDAEVISDVAHLLRKASRMGATTSQLEIPLNRRHGKLDAAVTVAAMRHDGKSLGYVIVFEDLSDVVKAQRQAAWREVARRVAHEIKNPLTPIALSAQRIQRYLERGTPDEQSLNVLQSCADTIASSVDTVRTLVDEFSTLARFPTAQPQPASINAIVENALAMFADRLNGITIQTFLAADLPKAMADAESLKRAIANLIDNAAEAMRDSLVKEMHISTALISSREAVEIVVADSGHGITPDTKEKLFLPYFSTKDRGTGLGLAIVSRIVEDHHGSIRVEENTPVGARFIIELPVSPEAVSQSAAHA